MSRHNIISVDVDIDLDDELDDEDLLEMVKARGLSLPLGKAEDGAMTNREWWSELANDIRAAARDNDRTHLEILLLRMTDGAGLTDFKPSDYRAPAMPPSLLRAGGRK
jgi:hypothetical protein